MIFLMITVASISSYLRLCAADRVTEEIASEDRVTEEIASEDRCDSRKVAAWEQGPAGIRALDSEIWQKQHNIYAIQDHELDATEAISELEELLRERGQLADGPNPCNGVCSFSSVAAFHRSMDGLESKIHKMDSEIRDVGRSIMGMYDHEVDAGIIKNSEGEKRLLEQQREQVEEQRQATLVEWGKCFSWCGLGVPLPPGWKAAVDAAKGKTYYYNLATETTQWVQPTMPTAECSGWQ